MKTSFRPDDKPMWSLAIKGTENGAVAGAAVLGQGINLEAFNIVDIDTCVLTCVYPEESFSDTHPTTTVTAILPISARDYPTPGTYALHGVASDPNLNVVDGSVTPPIRRHRFELLPR